MFTGGVEDQNISFRFSIFTNITRFVSFCKRKNLVKDRGVQGPL